MGQGYVPATVASEKTRYFEWALGPIWTGADNLIPSPFRDSIAGLSSTYRVARPTELSLPTYCCVLELTLRLLMSYIYIYIYIYMEHLFLMFLDHTQRRSTVGRTPLDE